MRDTACWIGSVRHRLTVLDAASGFGRKLGFEHPAGD